MKLHIALILLFLAATTTLAADRTPSPDGAEAYIVLPRNGATVESPVRIVFGLRRMGVAPAGVIAANTGHHHLLIDRDAPALSNPIPADDNTRHFGGGQTEASIDLAPGEHTLQLIMGDALHIPHDPPVMSEKITIVVRPPEDTTDVKL